MGNWKTSTQGLHNQEFPAIYSIFNSTDGKFDVCLPFLWILNKHQNRSSSTSLTENPSAFTRLAPWAELCSPVDLSHDCVIISGNE